MSIQRGDTVEGTFRPARTDDLKPGMDAWIGRRCRWEALWEIEPEDGGSYVGQWAWGPADATDRQAFPYLWIPSVDLRRRRSVRHLLKRLLLRRVSK